MKSISTSLLLILITLSSLSFAQDTKIDRNVEVDRAYSKLLSYLPEGAQLIHVPYADQLQSYGSNQKLVRIEDADVTGGKLAQVSVKRAGKNVWDDAVFTNIGGEIKKDDVIYMVFWGRVSPLDKSNEAVTLSAVGIQKASEPYDKFISNDVELSREWQTIALAGKATLDLANYGSQISIPISTGKHILEFGPVFVFNLGANVDMSTLPFL